ncbi:recombinase family protein [Streptomyces shaanxiensis]
MPRPVSTGAEPAGHVRLGYARASTVRQSLDAQLDSLAEAGVTRVFSEKISTRATRRPELEAAVTLAGEIRSSGVAVTSSSTNTNDSAGVSNSPCSPRN